MAVAAWVLRAVALVRARGAFDYPTDYDEGVYFSAAALLVRGVLPYRDFVFVHPPGLLLFLSSGAWLPDPATGFAVARWLATLVGAANVLLVGRLAHRLAGPVAAFAAAAAYAVYPEVALVERGPFLEPVLNLACLALANLWLQTPPRRALVAGLVGGLAVSVKLWGGLWLLACVASLPREQRLRHLLWLAAGAAAALVVAVAPLALAAPGGFWTDAVLFHALRPPDGDASTIARLKEIFRAPHRPLDVLALGGLVVALFRARLPEARSERLVATAFLLTIAAFLASPTYWSQYNAHLAPSLGALAGLFAATIYEAARARSRPLALASIPALAAAALLPLRDLRGTFRARSPEVIALGAAIRQKVSPGDCLFSFEPAWSLAGGRLPQMVDPYAHMLLAAVEGGRRFPDARAAFQDPGAQRPALELLERCRFAVLGWRGTMQLEGAGLGWFYVHFAPLAQTQGLELWERRP